MNIEYTEINGFLVDQFNQYGLEEGKTQGVCPLCSPDRQPKNQKQNVLPMIGNVVLALVIIVIELSNLIRINVKELVRKFMLDLKSNINQ